MRETKNPWAASLLLSSALLAGCATNSPPQPPVVAREIQLTPLPASVRSIGLKPSADWQARVSNYLSRVEDFSGSETSTCNACSIK
ncbi:hypothetical protein DETS111669_21525 [Delftia tsuruhatensis]